MHRRLPMICALVALLVITPAAAQPSDEQLCFPTIPAISNCIEGRFASYWTDGGGLSVFGYPISPPVDEINPDLQDTFATQWFERNRFEYHPRIQHPTTFSWDDLEMNC